MGKKTQQVQYNICMILTCSKMANDIWDRKTLQAAELLGLLSNTGFYTRSFCLASYLYLKTCLTKCCPSYISFQELSNVIIQQFKSEYLELGLILWENFVAVLQHRGFTSKNQPWSQSFYENSCPSRMRVQLQGYDANIVKFERPWRGLSFTFSCPPSGIANIQIWKRFLHSVSRDTQSVL